jgi:hypothetical protein
LEKAVETACGSRVAVLPGVNAWPNGPAGKALERACPNKKIWVKTRFNQEAFWLTLEDENLFNNCGAAGSFNYKVYYDNAVLGRESQ